MSAHVRYSHNHIDGRQLDKAYQAQTYSQVGEHSVGLLASKTTQVGFFRQKKLAEAAGKLFPREFFDLPKTALPYFNFTTHLHPLETSQIAAHRAFRKMIIACCLASALREAKAKPYRWNIEGKNRGDAECIGCLEVVTKIAFKAARCAHESLAPTSGDNALDIITEAASVAFQAAKRINFRIADETFKKACKAACKAGIDLRIHEIVRHAMLTADGACFNVEK
jgi:hypothetical protein